MDNQKIHAALRELALGDAHHSPEREISISAHEKTPEHDWYNPFASPLQIDGVENQHLDYHNQRLQFELEKMFNDATVKGEQREGGFRMDIGMEDKRNRRDELTDIDSHHKVFSAPSPHPSTPDNSNNNNQNGKLGVTAGNTTNVNITVNDPDITTIPLSDMGGLNTESSLEMYNGTFQQYGYTTDYRYESYDLSPSSSLSDDIVAVANHDKDTTENRNEIDQIYEHDVNTNAADDETNDSNIENTRIALENTYRNQVMLHEMADQSWQMELDHPDGIGITHGQIQAQAQGLPVTSDGGMDITQIIQHNNSASVPGFDSFESTNMLLTTTNPVTFTSLVTDDGNTRSVTFAEQNSILEYDNEVEIYHDGNTNR
jgi:hypothetical protein